jgi:3-methyladenine DNA glycosylase/8-oxoguanine DNA glycosylase
MTAPPPEAAMSYRPRHELDLGFAVLGMKTVRQRSGVHWWTTETPAGLAVVAFRAADGVVRADGWGPGHGWAFDRLPTLLGADDDPAGFAPTHPVVRELQHRFGAVRIGATGRWYEALAASAIGQRVVKADATASRDRLCARHGAPAPAGPAHGFPRPEAMLSIADHDFHRVGIERSRSRVLRVAAKHADRLERLHDRPGAEAVEWLRRLPGVGPWTSALASTIAGGDADAVPVGDLHLPRMVTFALTGHEHGTDDSMLEALEPFAGHRQRVVRLVKMGRAGPPRHRPAPFRSDISRI